MRSILGLPVRRIVVVAAAVAMGTWAGCTAGEGGDGSSFVQHCGDANGNATCVLAYPDRPYCSLCIVVTDHEGCIANPPAPACEPGHVGETGQSDESTTTSASGSTSAADTTMGAVDSSGSGEAGSSTTSSAEPCDDREGTLDESCMEVDPTRPYCVGGFCSSCTDAGGDDFCLAGDVDAPFCDAVAGLCGMCGAAGDGFCDGATPVCSGSGACVACTEHSDCPDSACHLAATDPLAGSCFGTDEVVWVDNGAICPGVGTDVQPYCSLAQTLANVSANTVVRLIGGNPYPQFGIVDGATVALLGQDTPEVTGSAAQNEASLQVENGILYVQGLRVRNNALSHGFSCGGGTLWLDDSEVRANEGWGVHTLSACTTVLRRTNLAANSGGGVRGLGGAVKLDNAAVGVNGDGTGGPGLSLEFADVDIVYSTIAGNNAATGSDSIQCDQAMGSVRNSVVTGVAAPSVHIDCFELDFSHNAIDTPGFATDGVAIGAYTGSWFVAPSLGDFRLIMPNNTPLGGVAQWQGGDALYDADGTARPTLMPGYAGVDEP